jgi:hypothetical protein
MVSLPDKFNCQLYGDVRLDETKRNNDKTLAAFSYLSVVVDPLVLAKLYRSSMNRYE